MSKMAIHATQNIEKEIGSNYSENTESASITPKIPTVLWWFQGNRS